MYERERKLRTTQDSCFDLMLIFRAGDSELNYSTRFYSHWTLTPTVSLVLVPWLVTPVQL